MGSCLADWDQHQRNALRDVSQICLLWQEMRTVSRLAGWDTQWWFCGIIISANQPSARTHRHGHVQLHFHAHGKGRAGIKGTGLKNQANYCTSLQENVWLEAKALFPLVSIVTRDGQWPCGCGKKRQQQIFAQTAFPFPAQLKGDPLTSQTKQ